MAAEFPFGKHKGRTIEWVFFHDPAYPRWALSQRIALNGEAGRRFEQLVRRASHLQIPGPCPWCKTRPVSRMFCGRHRDSRLASVTFDCDVCSPLGGSVAIESVPSFFLPGGLHSYDKEGSGILIAAIKNAYFGSPDVRLNQARMEEFFDNRNNFATF